MQFCGKLFVMGNGWKTLKMFESSGGTAQVRTSGCKIKAQNSPTLMKIRLSNVPKVAYITTPDCIKMNNSKITARG